MNNQDEVVSTVLANAATLVRKGWCQLVMALDADGDNCDPTDEFAVCWCALGAITRAATDIRRENYDLRDSATRRLRALVGPSIGLWNDEYGRTAEQVAEMLDKAAKGDQTW